MPNLVATVGDPLANSFETLDEADEYFLGRVPLPVPWQPADDTNIPSLIMAGRILNLMAVARRTLYTPQIPNAKPYYMTSRAWTGTLSSLYADTQSMAWPREQMRDNLGRIIPNDIIPIEVKWAQSELAGQLRGDDRTLDLDQVVQGVKGFKAGPVEFTFLDVIQGRVLPDAVINLLVPSWLTDEVITYATQRLIFEAI